MFYHPLRLLFVLVLPIAALTARAAEAYSSFGSAAEPYDGGGAVLVGPNATFGYQFTSAGFGAVSEIRIAMNNFSAVGPQAFTLALYANVPNGSSGTLGALLKTYSGTSSGQNFPAGYATPTAVSTGAPAILDLGAKYWLVATSGSSLAWNQSISKSAPRYFTNGGAPAYEEHRAGAFSVQVQAVPEPATMAPLGLGAVAMLRRRKRS